MYSPGRDEFTEGVEVDRRPIELSAAVLVLGCLAPSAHRPPRWRSRSTPTMALRRALGYVEPRASEQIHCMAVLPADVVVDWREPWVLRNHNPKL
jgi:hypothetical protein